MSSIPVTVFTSDSGERAVRIAGKFYTTEQTASKAYSDCYMSENYSAVLGRPTKITDEARTAFANKHYRILSTIRRRSKPVFRKILL